MDEFSEYEAARLAREAFATLLLGLGYTNIQAWDTAQQPEMQEERLKVVADLAKLVGIEAVKRIGFRLDLE